MIQINWNSPSFLINDRLVLVCKINLFFIIIRSTRTIRKTPYHFSILTLQWKTLLLILTTPWKLFKNFSIFAKPVVFEILLLFYHLEMIRPEMLGKGFSTLKICKIHHKTIMFFRSLVLFQKLRICKKPIAIQKHPLEVLYKNALLHFFSSIHRKTPLLESLFIEVSGL